MTATHLLYDGDGGWIEAKKVWMIFPHREVDGAPEDCWGWEFQNGYDVARWLGGPDV